MDQYRLAVVVGPIDQRPPLRVAELLRIFPSLFGCDLFIREWAKGVALVVYPPFAVRLNDDEPIRAQVRP